MGPDLVRPLRSTCFVGPPVFSQSIPPSKTKYGLIAFRARARARLVRGPGFGLRIRNCHLVGLYVRKNDFGNDPGTTLACSSTLLQPPATIETNLANRKALCYRFLHLYYSSSQPAMKCEATLTDLNGMHLIEGQRDSTSG